MTQTAVVDGRGGRTEAPNRFLRFLGAWVAGALGTTALAVIFQTQNLLARLNGLDAQVSLSERLSMTGYDLVHLGSVYLPFIAAGALAAYVAGMGVYRLAGFGRPVIFAVAGAVAMFVMLALMRQAFFGVDLIAGSRDVVGRMFQMLAGAIGGLIFAGVFPARARGR